MTKQAPTVYVVDDDEMVCEAIARVVRSTGLAVETFVSPTEFLQTRLDTPAEKAGVRGGTETVVVGNLRLPVGGDIIVEMDGEPTVAHEALTRRIENKRAGDTVRLTLFRGPRRLEVTIHLEARPPRR